MMFEFGPENVQLDPFSHIISLPFLDVELYQRLRAEFPPDEMFDGGPQIGGRSGRDIYRGDPEMESLLNSSPAWAEFHSFLNSAAFLDLALSLFGSQIEEAGCVVPASEMHFVDWTEPRSDLTSGRRRLRSRSRRNETVAGEIYCRLDLHQGGVSYAKPVHCDRPNRLVSMIIYFVDAAAIQCVGGVLGLHKSLKDHAPAEYPRHPKLGTTVLVESVEVAQNRGLFFPCSNNSYHSVSAIESTHGYRNFAYINLSSRADSIW